MISKPDTKKTNNLEEKEVIFISYDDIYYNKYITPKEIKDINKVIGIDNFIIFPKKSQLGVGDAGEIIETIVIPIAVSIFSSAAFELLKIAVLKLIEKMNKRFNKEKEKKYMIDFHIMDEKSGFNLDLTVDANAESKEIEALLDKAQKIVEIVKK